MSGTRAFSPYSSYCRRNCSAARPRNNAYTASTSREICARYGAKSCTDTGVHSLLRHPPALGLERPLKPAHRLPPEGVVERDGRDRPHFSVW